MSRWRSIFVLVLATCAVTAVRPVAAENLRLSSVDTPSAVGPVSGSLFEPDVGASADRGEAQVSRAGPPAVQLAQAENQLGTFSLPEAGGVWASPYLEAERAFFATPEGRRMEVQDFLQMAGYLDAASSSTFSQRLFSAIQSFQRNNGLPETGIVDESGYQTLLEIAVPILQRWQLEPVEHPLVGAVLWVPAGFLHAAERTEHGANYIGPDGLVIEFGFMRDHDLASSHEFFLSELADDTIILQSLNETSLLIRSENASKGSFTYFKVFPGGIIGFHMSWSPDSDILGDRLSWIMAGLFANNH